MTDWFTIVLVLGAVAGAAAFLLAKRRLPSLSRMGKVFVPLAFCMLGLFPAALLQCNFVERTAAAALGSIVYFIVFSVVATVALNGVVARSGG